MSRSYRKTPIVKDNGKSKKTIKSLANRKVRRKLNNPEFEMANGKAYRKEFESWDIADSIIYWTEEQAKQEYEKKILEVGNNSWFKKEWPTLESFLIFWKKCMKNK